MKRVLLSYMFAFVAVAVFAKPVPQQKTQRIADFFFHEYGGSSSLQIVDAPQFEHIHIYKATDGKGFVIMSADDVVYPLLAYSTTNAIDINFIPENVEFWLMEYENQIRWNIDNGYSAATAVAEKWQHLSDMVESQQTSNTDKAIKSTNSINLLSTTWSQHPYYNSWCPYDPMYNQKSVTGCVATAMAQIMKYWAYPRQGVGSCTYDDPTCGRQSANFANANFDFDLMPAFLDSSSTSEEVESVAKLIRYCGISVETYYGANGSSAATCNSGVINGNSAEDALRKNFKYLHTLHTIYLNDMTDSVWLSLIKNEIDNGRVVQYSGRGPYILESGHSFVCCGYDNTDKLYFNWGWGGLYDGNYAIGQLNPKSGLNFNTNNAAIIGIVPDSVESPKTTISLQSTIPEGCILSGGGTFDSYVDTVIIKAMAKPGYLVDGWDSNLYLNPFLFIANGGNVTHTARCTRINSDTVGFCHNDVVYLTSIGNIDSVKWAIRLDSASIAPHRQLESVQAFMIDQGEYVVRAYYGSSTAPDSIPASIDTLSYWRRYAPPSGGTTDDRPSWKTVHLSKPVPVDRTRSLWITITAYSHGISYINCSLFRGNVDGSWAYDNKSGSWINIAEQGDYHSWMMRGIFAENEGPYHITVTSDHHEMGTTTGTGTYEEGTIVTITATPEEGFIFVGWDDGDTAMSREIIVTDVATYTARFKEYDDPASSLISAYSNARNIIIENAADERADIYDVAGRLIISSNIKSSCEIITVKSGVYLVRINGQTFRCVVN
ncbi:MAG: thiol protease/hemagglutinin PrtT [Paludibacteraceae bacterium]|nr:thiol protease/hemagglutinin PrtT [Paludibacteraceae bacterium]